MIFNRIHYNVISINKYILFIAHYYHKNNNNNNNNLTVFFESLQNKRKVKYQTMSY